MLRMSGVTGDNPSLFIPTCRSPTESGFQSPAGGRVHCTLSPSTSRPTSCFCRSLRVALLGVDACCEEVSPHFQGAGAQVLGVNRSLRIRITMVAGAVAALVCLCVGTLLIVGVRSRQI